MSGGLNQAHRFLILEFLTLLVGGWTGLRLIHANLPEKAVASGCRNRPIARTSGASLIAIIENPNRDFTVADGHPRTLSYTDSP
jgi:hypothetical protein